MQERIVYGVQFYRQPGAAVEELERDMDVMVRAGITMIRLQEVWSYEEPDEGVYDFDKLNALVAAAAARGLDVVITLTLESIPPWLHQRHDVYQRNAFGEVIKETTPYPVPSDGKPGPCWDNPIARAAAERFVEAFMRSVGAHPAVKGFVIWQEPTVLPRTDPRGLGGSSYCHCAHTLDRFRSWLRERYGSLADMNAALMTNYARWEYVEPPASFMNPLSSAFCHFMRERMADIALWKRGCVERHDPLRRPLMCHAGYSIVTRGLGGGWHDDYMLARHVDVYGRSVYPKCDQVAGNPAEQVAGLVLAVDSARGAAPGKPVWLAELQVGRPAVGFTRYLAPEGFEIQNWILTCVARGAKGMVFWTSRDERLLNEAYGYGMLDRRGEQKPWTPAIGEAVRWLRGNDDVLAAALPPRARVAVAVNTDSFILGYQADREDLALESLQGLCRMFFRLGVPVDFLWNEQVHAGAAQPYDMLFLPFPLSMDDAYARALDAYVRSGGVLVSDGFAATFNEVSVATERSPGYGLSEVFGCEEEWEDVVSALHPAGGEDRAPVLRGTGSFDGCGIATRQFVQSFRLTTGEPVLTLDGRTAGVRNAHGKGTAYILGTFLGLAAKDGNLAFLRRLLDAHGIPLNDTPPLVTELRSPAGRAVWLFNGADTECRRTLAVPEGHSFRDAFGAAAQRDGKGVTLVVAPRRAALAVFPVLSAAAPG